MKLKVLTNDTYRLFSERGLRKEHIFLLKSDGHLGYHMFTYHGDDLLDAHPDRVLPTRDRYTLEVLTQLYEGRKDHHSVRYLYVEVNEGSPVVPLKDFIERNY